MEMSRAAFAGKGPKIYGGSGRGMRGVEFQNGGDSSADEQQRRIDILLAEETQADRIARMKAEDDAAFDTPIRTMTGAGGATPGQSTGVPAATTGKLFDNWQTWAIVALAGLLVVSNVGAGSGGRRRR